MQNLRIYNWCDLSPNEKSDVLSRPAMNANEDIAASVKKIISQIKEGTQNSLLEYARRFDSFNDDVFQVDDNTINESESRLDPSAKEAILKAFEQIKAFHEPAVPKDYRTEHTKGVKLSKKYQPIDKVGLYIPGGTTPLPSTVLMLGVPSMLAGCPKRTLITPADSNTSVHPSILFAAKLCGIEKIYSVGGAHGIAALAFGTEEIEAVDKIYGPGNAWVTEAKNQVSLAPNGAAQDLPAGPSEVMVISDSQANPSFIAADLLSQLEHGKDSIAILLSDSPPLLEAVREMTSIQLQGLSRQEILKESTKYLKFIKVDDTKQAFEISNSFAPEHLILQIQNPHIWQNKVSNAGTVFLGEYAPESLGDYATGSNHVLPTYGFAKAYSGLCVRSFMKHITFQEVTPDGFSELAYTVETLARIEGLDAHKQAVSIRMNALNSQLGKESS